MLPKLAREEGPWCDLEFDVPDHGHQDRTALLMVSNNPYDFNARFGRRPRLDGGVLGVVALNPESVGDLIGVTVFAAARKPDLARCLWTWTTARFSIGSRHAEISAGVDGETVRFRSPLEFSVAAGGARVLVPRGTRIGLDEQSAAPSGYSGLLEVAFNLPGGDRGDGRDGS
jgi:diacylglycerol kinase family enzyme